jgi:hypothetical protein
MELHADKNTADKIILATPEIVTAIEMLLQKVFLQPYRWHCM